MSKMRSSVVVRSFEVPLGGVPADWPGMRIAQITDFHFRRWDRNVQAAQDHLCSLDYDLLAVTGDFGCRIKHWRRPAELTRRFFEPLAERAPIYAVLGNHDHVEMATAPGIPMTFLRNQSVRINLSGLDVELAGVEQTRDEPGDLAAALEPGKTAAVTILLAHYPSTVYRLPPGRVDLQLSGHTHGGQIRLPLLGCLWTNDCIPRSMARGLHRVSDTWLHVSPGIGVSPPLFMRVNCPPEVTVLDLKPACVLADESLRQPEAVALVR